MNSYKFETDQIGFSDKGLHLLRSRFNYDTIEYSVIDKIIIERGRQVRNWFVAFAVGLLLFCAGTYSLIKIIYEYFFADNYHHFYIEQFAFPIIPIFLGTISIYYSFKSGPVLSIVVGNKTKKYPLGQLIKTSQLSALISFLESNALTKNKISNLFPDASS